MPTPTAKTALKLPNAQPILKNALSYILGFEGLTPTWRKEYDQVAAWLEDTKGRGLFLAGDCGLGKSILGRYVIPAIFLKYHRRVISVYDMRQANTKLDEILNDRLISLDDVGTEDIANTYGNKRMAFAEIMDAAEKNNKLVIVTTNLNADGIVEKYGARVMDRILKTTVRVKFTGKSLRLQNPQ